MFEDMKYIFNRRRRESIADRTEDSAHLTTPTRRSASEIESAETVYPCFVGDKGGRLDSRPSVATNPAMSETIFLSNESFPLVDCRFRQL